MTTALGKSVPFLLGFGFALLPNVGPFVGLLFLFADRWPLRRSDGLWWGAALLLALPLAVHGGVRGFLFGALQVLAPWLIYRTFARLYAERAAVRGSFMGLGLLSGLALVVGLGFLHGSGFGGTSRLAQTLVWDANTNLYGHTVFLLGSLFALLLSSTRLRLLSLALAALGVLASGSPEALLAWLAVAAALLFLGYTKSWRGRAAHVALIAAVSFMALRVSPASLWNLPGPLRLAYWGAAWEGFLTRPLWGWGETAFANYYHVVWSAFDPTYAVPSHAHNLGLHVLFSRGLVGFLGLLLLVAALTWAALKSRDLPFLSVVAALLVANTFDATLFYGGVIYPLAAVAGWRSASYARARERAGGAQGGVVRFALAAADFGAAGLALGLALLLRGWLGLFLDSPLVTPPNLQTAFYALLLWPAMAWREGLYPGYGLTAPQELRKGVSSAAYAGLILMAGTLLFYEELLPRSVFLLTTLLTMVFCPVGRAFVKRALHAFGLWGRPVVILGAGQAGRRVARALRRRPLDGLEPVAFFDDDAGKQGLLFEGVRVRGSLGEANAYALARGVSHAIVAIPTASSEELAGLVNGRGHVFKRVQFVPNLAGLPSREVYASDLDGMLALEVRSGLYAPANRLAKRALDLLGGGVCTLLASPLLLALALWIRLDSPGPAFYESARIGQGGETFRCLKFRTMYKDADARLGDLMSTDPGIFEEYTRYHKLQEDPRVTPAGRFLRRTSLDELPQLFNVLTGEMSLVGPRPYLTRERSDMGERAPAILEAKPGVTGYWQVSGRNEITFEDRLEMEAHYVRNWSIWWDIVILTQTAAAVLGRQGAR